MADTFLENFSLFMMRLAKFFVKLAIFCVLMYYIGMKLFDIGEKLFYEKAMSETDDTEIMFEISSTDTVDDIGENLKNKGLIDDPLIFKFRATIYKTNFTPNVYKLKKTMTIKNMLDIFDNPNSEQIVLENDDTYQLTPEGETENIEESESE